MIVSRRHKFVFVRNPKTASKAIGLWLKERFEVEDLSVNCGRYSFDQHGWKIPEEFKGYRAFVVVRHPFSRTFSAWRQEVRNCKYEMKPTPSFEEFIRNSEFMVRTNNENEFTNAFCQSHFVDLVKSRSDNLKVLKYESINCGVPDLSNELIKVVGESDLRWFENYSQDLESLVLRKLSLDYKTFGYYRSLSML